MVDCLVVTLTLALSHQGRGGLVGVGLFTRTSAALWFPAYAGMTGCVPYRHDGMSAISNVSYLERVRRRRLLRRLLTAGRPT